MPPLLSARYLISNVRSICDADGKMLTKFVDSHWAKVLSKHSVPGFGMSVAMTGWIGDISDNEFFRFRGSFKGINGDASDKTFSLCVEGGAYTRFDGGIVNDDRFAEIKLDTGSIKAAMDDVLKGSIVLRNDPAFEPRTCPYMRDSDED